MILHTTIAIVGSTLFSGLIVYFFTKKWNESHYTVYVERAKAKAKTIEEEAKLFLEKAELEAQEKAFAYKESTKIELDKQRKVLQDREEQLENKIQKELKTIQDDKIEIKSKLNRFDGIVKEGERLNVQSQKKINEMLNVLGNYTGFTEQEAKNQILKEVEERAKLDIAKTVRKYEKEALENAQSKANYILAQATTRFAHDFVNERLTTSIKLDSDDMKGRIIGKDGRNIQALENLLGVDIIIDETPNTISVSSFNLYRRAIAKETIELLMEDGRVQPSRIEEIYERTFNSFEEKTYQDGQQVLLDLRIDNIHTDIIKLIGKLKYRTSFGQNALNHSIEVAHFASIISSELGGDPILARRAGILHDIGKALTHEKPGSHIDLGAEICRRYGEDEIVINGIYAHHEIEEAKSIECAAVCAADVLSAARPGARREAVESYIKRLESIENIAYSKKGVLNAYAINAGREIRVIVNAKVLDDNQTYLISKEIAKQIEKDIQYPGKIKVNVIREVRSVDYAS